jgi:UDP-hydrolysing UDP-N-acetyl-D-glucosamine 2-epimerase
MRSTLEAISLHSHLQLQLIVTGMHLDHARGRSIDGIRSERWKIDAQIPWKTDGTRNANAIATGAATAALAEEFQRLKTEIVLVTGDRVEAFAAASAAHLGGLLVAHVHGGDRALGLIDDSLRHAITKLAHVHFPATRQSAERIARLGEQKWRIFRVGTPGLDGIKTLAASRSDIAREIPQIQPGKFAMVLLHPQTHIADNERHNARWLLSAVLSSGFEKAVVIYPNNDPGSDGIAEYWDTFRNHERVMLRRDLPRQLFLGLLRESAALIGNSSSGIIEAASFGTPVVDLGTRQQGRERGDNVIHIPMGGRALARQLRLLWNNGTPQRFQAINPYRVGGAGPRIANTLSQVNFGRFLPKLIAY